MTRINKLLFVCCLMIMGTYSLSARTIFLRPGSWDTGDAKFAVWMPSKSAFSDFMTAVYEEDGLYQTTIPDGVTDISFYTCGKEKAAPAWEGEYLQTISLTITTQNQFTITGLDGKEPTKYTGTWTTIDELPTFDIVFKDNGTAVDIDKENPLNNKILTNTSPISEFVTKGSDLIASFSEVTDPSLTSLVVNARSGKGIRLQNASFTLNLAAPRKLDHIEILAAKSNSDKTIVINGTEVAIDSGRYVIDCANKVVSSITIASPTDKSAYILALSMFDSKVSGNHVYLADWSSEIGTFTANGTCTTAEGAMSFPNSYNAGANYFEVLPIKGATFSSGDTIAITQYVKNDKEAQIQIYDADAKALFLTDKATKTPTESKFVLTKATSKLLLARSGSTTIFVSEFQVYQKQSKPTVTVTKAVNLGLSLGKNATTKGSYLIQGYIADIDLDIAASNKKAADEGLPEYANTISVVMSDKYPSDGTELEINRAKPVSEEDKAISKGCPIVIDGKISNNYDAKTGISWASLNDGTYYIKKFLIRFMNEDNLLQSDSLRYGVKPVYAGETPVRAKTAKWTYTFKGWDKPITAVSANTVYTADFDSTINTYRVRLVIPGAKRFEGYADKDTIVLADDSLDYGTRVDKLLDKDILATKLQGVQWIYEIKGWTPAYNTVQGDVIYVAKLDSTLRQYDVVFKDRDIIWQNTKVNYGTKAAYTNDTPTRAATNSYTYTFKGWEPDLAIVTGNQTYTAKFDSTQILYTITFLDYDFKTLSTTQLPWGATPKEPIPSRDATAQWTYIFKGWDVKVVPVDGENTYVARYDSTLNQYTIRFENYDGTLLQSSKLSYGSMPTCPTPSRPSDSYGSYSFKEWEPALAPVTGDQTYTAVFEMASNQYTIIFLNYDGGILQAYKQDNGKMPVYTAETPTRPASQFYTYSFKGWDKPLAVITGTATYTAEFDSTRIAALITFNNYDGKTLQSGVVKLNVMPEYNGEEPTRESSAQYEYKFKGWDKTIVLAVDDAVYTAEYDSVVRSYTVRFVNYDGKVLQESEYKYGEKPIYKGETPTHPSTSQYSYTFIGWGKQIVPVTGDITYTAQFEIEGNKFSIQFLDYDGSLIEIQRFEYGETPTYERPTREGTAEYTYRFRGWIPEGQEEQLSNALLELPEVKGNATYIAFYDSVVNKYTIQFVNYDGTVLSTQELAYGTTPTYKGKQPSRPVDAQYRYKFSGWDPELAPVTGDQTYTAAFSTELRSYTIRFVNYDGSYLLTANMHYGDLLSSYSGKTPTHPDNGDWVYTFAGWNPNDEFITGAATYTAVFDSILKPYDITFLNYDGTLLKVIPTATGSTPVYDGETPVHASSALFNYTFAGWTPQLKAVEEEATYTAQFDSVRIACQINFIDYNGEILETKIVPVGQTPVFTGSTPSRPATAEYTYTFKGWTPELQPATTDIDYKAEYESVANTLHIEFRNYDGTKLQEDDLNLGDMPQYAGETPSRPATAQYTYTFKGWTPDVVVVSEAAVYTAVFDSVLNRYAINYINADGSPIITDSVEYGKVPVFTGNAPQMTPTEEYDFEFKGWTPALAAVEGDATYKAEFDSLRCYRITITPTEGFTVKGDGRYREGSEVTIEAIAEDTYNFVAWSDSVIDNPRQLTLTQDIELSIIGLRDSFYVVLVINDSTMGTVSGTGVYEINAEIEIEAVPNNGYEFVEWSDGVKDAKRTLKVTENIVLTANFQVISGLHDITETDWVAINGRDVIITAPEDMVTGIYSVNGQLIYYGYDRIITLPQAGNYVIRLNNYVGKAVVK